jgi:hypothetical protein
VGTPLIAQLSSAPCDLTPSVPSCHPRMIGPPTNPAGSLLEQNPRGSLGRAAVGNELARLCKINPGARQDH